MCTIEEKEELEALKAWRLEASKALKVLQEQVRGLDDEVECIKQQLGEKDDEIKALRKILGVSEAELKPPKKSKSVIILGMPRFPAPWKADKPQTNGTTGSPPLSHQPSDTFNIGQHKINHLNSSEELQMLDHEHDSPSFSYEAIPSPLASSLQIASLQTFGSLDDPPSGSSEEHSVALNIDVGSQISNDFLAPVDSLTTNAVIASAHPAPETNKEVVEPVATTDSEVESVSIVISPPSDSVGQDLEQNSPTSDHPSEPAILVPIEDQTIVNEPDEVTSETSDEIPTVQVTTGPVTGSLLNSLEEFSGWIDHSTTESTELTEPEETEEMQVIEEIQLPDQEEKPVRSLTPQIPRRDLSLRPRSFLKPLLKIEIPASAFLNGPVTPTTPHMMNSPHLPAAPAPTPVSTPMSTPDVTPVSTPTSAPSTPKLLRPKLPARMAAELVAKGSTLKRTSGPTIKRVPSESLSGNYSPPVTPASPTDIAELYAPFNSGSSDAESDPGSPHRLQISVSEDMKGIYSPESSDSEDSFLKFKGKFSDSNIEPEALRRYEQDAKRVVLVQKVIKGWVQRRRFEKIRKRTEATKELLSTELGYAKCLDLLVHHYVKPLRSNSTSPNAYILPSQVDEIFSTIEDIKQSSSMLLIELDSLLKSWHYFSSVGSVMLAHVDSLQPHMPFVVNYERSHEVLATLNKNKEFAAFLKRRMSSSELDYKTLDDFLIEPVQRIPRYIMLLEAIYKYTPASHPDRDTVRKATHQMRLLAEKINKRKAATAKLSEFCCCLKAYEGEALMQETRYLVREGSVTNDKKRPRYAALLNDLLIICKPPEFPKSSKKEPPKKPQYRFVMQMKLDASTNLQVRPVGAPGVNNTATPYIVTLKNGPSQQITFTTGAEDGKGWSKDVHSVLDTLRKKK